MKKASWRDANLEAKVTQPDKISYVRFLASVVAETDKNRFGKNIIRKQVKLCHVYTYINCKFT